MNKLEASMARALGLLPSAKRVEAPHRVNVLLAVRAKDGGIVKYFEYTHYGFSEMLAEHEAKLLARAAGWNIHATLEVVKK